MDFLTDFMEGVRDFRVVGDPSFKPTEKESKETYRERKGISHCSLLVARRPSATTRSTAAGTPGLPELEREPRRHINEECSREKLREHRSQPIIRE